MADKGDKFVIEIGDVTYLEGDDGLKRRIHRVKGFNTLILDDYVIGKLKPLAEEREEIYKEEA